MSKDQVTDLLLFIKPYPAIVQETALLLRAFVWDLYPDSNELIYDNYNAVAFGWSLTARLGHTFCSVAVLSRYVHFGFYWGSEIRDPKKYLLGKGNQYRYIIVENIVDFPKQYMTELVKEAYVNSLAKVRDESELIKGLTIVKSVSLTKKRPGLVHIKSTKSKK